VKHEIDWTPLEDLLEAVIAVVLLGITVAVLYRLIMGEVPWTFFVGEVVGLGMGISLLMVATPRRRRR
jgi:F0F1-type ATP synthase assembly protein I